MNNTTRGFLYIALAWILIVCYSMLLMSTAESIIDLLTVEPPDDYVKQIVIFLYGLAVVSFLGGSQIPAVFLKKRNFTVQFAFSATFGFILLLITMLNETYLEPFSDGILKPFFSSYPIIALEYLSIPYLFMVFLDLHLSGRLGAFSWKRFSHFLSGTFIHPRLTFEEVMWEHSTLFSLASAIIVSLIWMVRTAAFSQVSFVPARWRLVPFGIAGSLKLIHKVTLAIPVVLLVWLILPLLVHIVGRELNGKGSFSSTASLLGFAFLPSSVVVVVDMLESGLQLGSSLFADLVFVVLGFIPVIAWPFALVIFAIQTSEELSARRACLTTSITFLPLFMILSIVFL